MKDREREQKGQVPTSLTAGGAPIDYHVPEVRSPPLLVSSRFATGLRHLWQTLLGELKHLEGDEEFVTDRITRSRISPGADEGRSGASIHQDGIVRETRTRKRGRLPTHIADRIAKGRSFPSEASAAFPDVERSD